MARPRSRRQDVVFVTIKATIPLPEGAVEQARATLAVNDGMQYIRERLSELGATYKSEKMDFGQEKAAPSAE